MIPWLNTPSGRHEDASRARAVIRLSYRIVALGAGCMHPTELDDVSSGRLVTATETATAYGVHKASWGS